MYFFGDFNGLFGAVIVGVFCIWDCSGTILGLFWKYSMTIFAAILCCLFWAYDGILALLFVVRFCKSSVVSFCCLLLASAACGEFLQLLLVSSFVSSCCLDLSLNNSKRQIYEEIP